MFYVENDSSPPSVSAKQKKSVWQCWLQGILASKNGIIFQKSKVPAAIMGGAKKMKLASSVELIHKHEDNHLKEKDSCGHG